MSNIVVPVLGESIVEARIAKWLKKPGDHVEVGDPLVELETEKTNLELSAEKRGVITSIARKEGEDVKIGELLAVVDENGAGAAPPAAAQSGNGSKTAASAPMLPDAATPSPPTNIQASSLRISPKRFVVTMISNCSGARTSSMAQVSTSISCIVISGYSFAISRATARNNPQV